MENKNKFCPLAKNYSLEESCAWYVCGPNQCAVNALAQYLDTITDRYVEISDEDEN